MNMMNVGKQIKEETLGGTGAAGIMVEVKQIVEEAEGMREGVNLVREGVKGGI